MPLNYRLQFAQRFWFSIIDFINDTSNKGCSGCHYLHVAYNELDPFCGRQDDKSE